VRAYEALKNYPQALDAANQILTIARSQKLSFGEPAAFAQMGRIYRASGDYQKSVDASTQALTLFQKSGVRDGEANVLDNLGSAYNGLKQPQQAIDAYNKALVLRRTLGDASGEAETLFNIAKIERDRNNLDIAQKQIEASLKIVESLRSKVTSQDLRSSYFASVQRYYDFYVDLLMRRHKQQPTAGYDAKALQASERARARSLVELLTEANVDIRQGVAPALLERERSLKQQIDAKTEQQVQLLNSSQSSQAAALKQELDALLSQYQQVQVKFAKVVPATPP
jgi:tetratricopeptide (TPR) repeat protein